MGVLVFGPIGEPKCDFCSRTDIVIAYLVDDFEIPELGWGSKGAFAACSICKELIEAGLVDTLRERSVQTFKDEYGGIVPEVFMRRFINRLHSEFWIRLRHPVKGGVM